MAFGVYLQSVSNVDAAIYGHDVANPSGTAHGLSALESERAVGEQRPFLA